MDDFSLQPGHVEKVKFDDDGRTVDVITKSMRPLLFGKSFDFAIVKYLISF